MSMMKGVDEGVSAPGGSYTVEKLELCYAYHVATESTWALQRIQVPSALDIYGRRNLHYS